MEPFIVGEDITNIEYLFGRQREVEILLSCAKRKSNAGIIGARRFGKTSLLRTMEAYLKEHTELNAYPLFFDAKCNGIEKDTPQVYRRMASLLASQMCKDGLLPTGEFKISRRCSLDVSDDMLDMVVQMKEWEPEYQKESLFILSEIVAANNKYVLLLLDEIDYLLPTALESPVDFSRIRTAATDRGGKLRFWGAGVSSWSDICTDVGSPELNCGLENIPLPSLSEEDHSTMWSFECSMIEDVETKNHYLSLCDNVYSKTGGVPYYSKFIGAHMYMNHSFVLPEYDIIRDYLAEIVNNRFMSDVERSTLFQLADGGATFDENKSDGLNGLITKGLVKESKNYYSICVGYLIDYLKARKQDSVVSNVEEIEAKELESMVDEIARLRNNVNMVYKECKPFLTSTEDPMEFSTLKKMCHDEASMNAFSGSIYKLYYEGSDKGQNLPKDFFSHDFSNMVRALRHIFNHRECDPTSMTTQNLLKLISRDGNMPYKPDDYSYIQKSMLKAFHKELIDMLESKDDMLENKDKESTPTSPKLVSGIFHKGVAGSKDTVVDNKFGNYQTIRTIRKGVTLTDGDEVEYYLCSEPNKNDPSRKFWFALDVHLKE